MLDYFQDFDEILKIIQFQTGKTQAEIAKSIGYARETMSVKKKGESEKIVKLLKSTYSDDISQFVTKFGKIYTEGGITNGLDQKAGRTMTRQAPANTSSRYERKTQLELEALDEQIQSLHDDLDAKLSEVADRIIDEIRKGRRGGAGKKGTRP